MIPAMPTLVVLRGNSGSGKSTVARRLRDVTGPGTVLVEQDYIRRTMLQEPDVAGAANIDLIDQIVRFALERDRNVILEGILNAARYGDMLRRLVADHPNSYFYYFDVPFEETLKRHVTKAQAGEFGADEMRSWWCGDDRLHLPTERRIPGRRRSRRRSP